MRTVSALRFIPPLALMGLIYFLSDQPDLSTGLGVWDLILRKIAHMSAYAALTLLWLRALGPFTGRALIWAVAIAILFAISDEYHQTFVEGRHGSPVDVGIDTVGIVIAVLISRTRGFRRWGSTGRRPA